MQRLLYSSIGKHKQSKKALILLTSTLQHLHEAMQETTNLLGKADFTIVAQDDIAPGLAGIEAIDRIITSRRVGQVSFSICWHFIAQIRSKRYDLCVLLLSTERFRVGIRASFVALAARSKRRLAHVHGTGFLPLRKALLASLAPGYIARRPFVLVDKLAAFLIRRVADLLVRFVLWRDRHKKRSVSGPNDRR